jgi:hypothetical protein
MFGCLGRIGCLIIVAVVGAIAWFTQDAWLPRVRAEFTTSAPSAKRGPTSGNSGAAADPGWTLLSADGAERGREAVAKLNQKNGPSYVNVGAADLAAFVLDSVLHGFSASATGAEAIARDDRLYLRAQVSAADLGGPKTLGPLSGLVQGKQELTIGGRLEVVSPGQAQFRVEEVSVGELKLPTAIIPKLIERATIKHRDPSVPSNAIPVQVPSTLADVRVSKGHITLYKTTP